MTHLSPQVRALYAGRDLGQWARWRAERHLAVCADCRPQLRSAVARDWMRRVPVYDQLLDKFPDAVVRLTG